MLCTISHVNIVFTFSVLVRTTLIAVSFGSLLITMSNSENPKSRLQFTPKSEDDLWKHMYPNRGSFVVFNGIETKTFGEFIFHFTRYSLWASAALRFSLCQANATLRFTLCVKLLINDPEDPLHTLNPTIITIKPTLSSYSTILRLCTLCHYARKPGAMLTTTQLRHLQSEQLLLIMN